MENITRGFVDFFTRWTREKTPQNNFSSQKFSKVVLNDTPFNVFSDIFSMAKNENTEVDDLAQFLL